MKIKRVGIKKKQSKKEENKERFEYKGKAFTCELKDDKVINILQQNTVCGEDQQGQPCQETSHCHVHLGTGGKEHHLRQRGGRPRVQNYCLAG